MNRFPVDLVLGLSNFGLPYQTLCEAERTNYCITLISSSTISLFFSTIQRRKCLLFYSWILLERLRT